VVVVVVGARVEGRMVERDAGVVARVLGARVTRVLAVRTGVGRVVVVVEEAGRVLVARGVEDGLTVVRGVERTALCS
jgi:hypothetical protein